MNATTTAQPRHYTLAQDGSLTWKTASLSPTPPAYTSMTSQPARFLLRRLRLKTPNVAAAWIFFVSSAPSERSVCRHAPTMPFNTGYWCHKGTVYGATVHSTKKRCTHLQPAQAVILPQLVQPRGQELPVNLEVKQARPEVCCVFARTRKLLRWDALYMS